MLSQPNFDIAGPSKLISLGFTIAALIIMFFLIVIIETTVLQLMRWGKFRGCLKASFWMNLGSTLVGFLFLAMVPRFGLLGLFFGWLVSVCIEVVVLMRLKPGQRRHNWLVSLISNLVSYLILLLPTYYYSQPQ